MPTHEWTIQGVDLQPIFGDTHSPPDGTVPIGQVILSHGFKGYKDYGLLPRLADHLATAGLIAHRFNFSHSGMTRQYETFERPDLFERDTWMKQVFDLTSVVDQVRQEQTVFPVVLFGHSRGGVTSLLTAARLAGVGRPVAGVVTAASPADASRLTDEQAEILKRAGRMSSPSGRTGQELFVGRAWLDEIEADPEGHDPIRAAGNLGCPLLAIHGDDDDTVPVADVHRLTKSAGTEPEVILDANHVFNAPNPMPKPEDQKPSEQTRQLFELVKEFALNCCRDA
jgi:alpha-beta hydrolase superfamily lysophospholipase